MGKLIDLTGERFGRWTVLSKGELNSKSRFKWLCKCDCGNLKEVNGHGLRSGQSKSCGCLHNEVKRNLRLTHGMSRTPEYRAWMAMKGRCNNPNSQGYDRYGGRGIVVCDRWADSFENFYEDMGSRPSSDHSLDREDNNGSYTPDNCKWSTIEEQQNNKSTNVVLRYGGKTLTLTQWARELGVTPTMISNRYHRGWSTEEILTLEVTETGKCANRGVDMCMNPLQLHNVDGMYNSTLGNC